MRELLMYTDAWAGGDLAAALLKPFMDDGAVDLVGVVVSDEAAAWRFGETLATLRIRRPDGRPVPVGAEPQLAVDALEHAERVVALVIGPFAGLARLLDEHAELALRKLREVVAMGDASLVADPFGPVARWVPGSGWSDRRDLVAAGRVFAHFQLPAWQGTPFTVVSRWAALACGALTGEPSRGAVHRALTALCAVEPHWYLPASHADAPPNLRVVGRDAEHHGVTEPAGLTRRLDELVARGLRT